MILTYNHIFTCIHVKCKHTHTYVHTRNVVLKLLQLINVLLGENVDTGRQQLSKLDESRSKLKKALQKSDQHMYYYVES